MSVKGVLMSTFLSSPPLSFFTFTLHAERENAIIRIAAIRNRMEPPLLRGQLRNSGASWRNARNRDRQVTVELDLSEQRLGGGHLRNRCRRKRTNIILHLGKVFG